MITWRARAYKPRESTPQPHTGHHWASREHAGALIRAPRANAIAERWIASVRRECLDRMLITGERHPWLVLGEYADHYNSHRPHRALWQNPPARRPHEPAEVTGMRVLRRDRLGGLIHEYTQVA